MKDIWLLTGDTHADFTRFANLPIDENAHYRIIILGDAGVNYWLGARDRRLKEQLKQDFPYITFYLVRGNHEARSEHLKTGERKFDGIIKNYVIVEPNFPNLIYLLDGHEYVLNNKRTLVIGGAYSVDKEYRQMMRWQWFEDEQLSEEERDNISRLFVGNHYDMILSHTCPLSMQPRHLFLPKVDQSKVDDSMERWLDEFRQLITYDQWWWGHYHADWDYDEQHHMLFEGFVKLA